jgi:GDPmannose 4,6-dehydratase
MPKALITGINGQDGSYLAELLLGKGYEVHGTVRRSSLESNEKRANILHIEKKLSLHPMMLDNHLSVYKLIQQVQPDECYHLAASSFVSYSFEDEASILETNFNSTHYLLSSIKELVPLCRFYFAGSSEMFGNATTAPQDETTSFQPRSIYGISKLASYHVVKTYRDFHELFACTGITYNHESERRGRAFVTRKVATQVARIALQQETCLELGNLDACRDWGYAPEYVQAMCLMLQNPAGPRDYVIATGKLHSVRDLLRVAFSAAELEYEKYVKVNEGFFRPGETVPLVGNAARIAQDLGWTPKSSFDEMIRAMVQHELSLLKAGH